MPNQVILMCIIYYFRIVINVFQHIHFYESYLFIHRAKLHSCCFKYGHLGITISDLVIHFAKRCPKSHISELINYHSLPEAFQHARTAIKLMSKDINMYYHVSAPFHGCDAFAFNRNHLQYILDERNVSLITFYEKKMMAGMSWGLSKVIKFYELYSVPKLEGLIGNRGARPCPVNELELGAYSQEGFRMLEKLDVSNFEKPRIIIENYSPVYVKLVRHPKHNGLADGTIISDSAFEELKYFYHLLEENEELCLYMNSILEENPLFPL